MPCFCGQKVERAQTSVQCEKCKEVFHLQCVVGTLAADLNYFKNADEIYICGDCAVAHREVEMSSHNAVAVQQQHQHVNNEQNHLLSSILAELKSLRTEQASAVAVIHSLQADKNRFLGELELMRSQLQCLTKICDEGVASALASLTSEVKELSLSVSKNKENKNKEIKGRNKNNKNAKKDIPTAQQNSAKASVAVEHYTELNQRIEELSNNNAMCTVVSAEKVSVAKSVVSSTNINNAILNTPIYSIANAAVANSVTSTNSVTSVPAVVASNNVNNISYVSRVATPSVAADNTDNTAVIEQNNIYTPVNNANGNSTDAVNNAVSNDDVAGFSGAVDLNPVGPSSA
ncbi:serine/threonine-protein kinase pakD-like [Rhagoletis pomonella]|uniref:serine/threonine-protein kinase pakD-like n=1 Tax=Rhagoletis pomonella TaxID=28610 RepID=UPI0017839D30|nr:serine/threonine-protein kinase pakD-like [Rhagoletis pomonella]